MLQAVTRVWLVHKITGLLSGLRSGELRRVLPIATAYGLVLASLYLLKPARNALFLTQVGVDRLPYVLLVVAGVGAVTTLTYGRFARSMRTDRLIRSTFLSLMVMLVVFRILLPAGQTWVYYVFFVWVALYGVLTTSLIWLLANTVFTAREARRVFGFIGTGGIAGAIFGGLFTGWVVPVLGTENLVLVCILFLGVALALLRLTQAAGRAAEDGRPVARSIVTEPADGLRDVLRDDLLRTLAVITGLVAVVAVIVDIQFNAVVDRALVDQDAKTAFFGQFFAYLSGLSIIVQLFATPLLLRTAGAPFTVMVLPVAMGLGSTAMLISPVLLSAIIAKGADGGFRHSIHKAASEVIFLPVPAGSKKVAKLFLDTTVDASATGLGALLVMALTGPLGLELHHLSAVAMGLVAVALAMAPGMRFAYVNAFRQAIERRTIDLSAVTTNLSEAVVLKALLPVLSRNNRRQVLYALDLLTSAQSPGIAQAVWPLLSHPSADVRRRALSVLRGQSDPRLDQTDRLTPLLDDPDEAVRLEAMMALSEQAGVDQRAFFVAHLESGDPLRQATALTCIAQSDGGLAEALLTEARIEKLLAQIGPDDHALRGTLAAALTIHPDPQIAPQLLERLSREPLAVQRLAIDGMGRSRQLRYVEFLVDNLDVSGLRRSARRSLARYGDAAVPAILFELDNPARSFRVLQMLARVLEDVGTQAAADALLAHLSAADPRVRRETLRSLSRLRTAKPDLIFTRDVVHRALMLDIERFYDLARTVRRSLIPDSPSLLDRAAEQLLFRAIREKQTQIIEHIFWLLGLRYRPRDIANAYHGIRSRQRTVHASALEFLENLLQPPLKTLILPIVDPPPQGLAQIGAELFPKALDCRADALGYFLRGPDPWLRACAIYGVQPSDPAPLTRLVRAACDDRDPIVREVAEAVMLKRFRADDR